MRDEQIARVLGLAHDMNGAVALLRSNVEFLIQEADGERLEAARDMVDCTRQLERLLAELAANVRDDTRDGGRAGPFAVSPFAERLQRMTRALLAGQDVDVRLARTGAAPDHILCDPHVVERVVLNLCTNAARHTCRGHVTIELDGEPGWLVIGVTDTGSGISTERLSRLLCVDRGDDVAGGGGGLGLGIVIDLLRQVGGRLEASSEPGCGSTFRAYFQVAPGSGGGAEPQPGATANIVTIRRSPFSQLRR